jgi:hypothetical protein
MSSIKAATKAQAQTPKRNGKPNDQEKSQAKAKGPVPNIGLLLLQKKTKQIKNGWQEYDKSRDENGRLARDIGGWLDEANELCLKAQKPWLEYLKENGFSQSMAWRFRKVYQERSTLFAANDKPLPRVFIILNGRKPEVEGTEAGNSSDSSGSETTMNNSTAGGDTTTTTSSSKPSGKPTPTGDSDSGSGEGSDDEDGDLEVLKVKVPKRTRQRWQEIVKAAKEYFRVNRDSEAVIAMANEWMTRIGTVPQPEPQPQPKPVSYGKEKGANGKEKEASSKKVSGKEAGRA